MLVVMAKGVAQRLCEFTSALALAREGSSKVVNQDSGGGTCRPWLK